MGRKIGDFKLDDKECYWYDNISKDIIIYWYNNVIHLLSNRVGDKYVNEEMLLDNHLKFRNGRFEGIIINNSSRDAVTTNTPMDRFIKQVLPYL